MANEPASGTSRIVSLNEGNPPASINLVKPLSQIVRLNEPAQQWTRTHVGDYLYQLGVGGYPYTGIADGKVIATTNFAENVIWHVTPREAQNAYTIEVADDQGLGWTVPADLSNNPAVEIKPLIIPTGSDAPQFKPSQLWRFQGSFDE